MKYPDCGGSGEISRGWMQERCSYCGGTGYVPTNVFGVNGAIKCDFCDGSGVFITNAVEPMTEQTNEEWLRTCSTEELAEFIRQQRDDWSDGWYSDCHRFEEIVEWLKQPHTKE